MSLGVATASADHCKARRKLQHKELVVLGCAALVCIGVPLLAKRQLEQRVEGDLARAASESFGLPIELGQASVGLTGTLEIQDVRVASVFRADRVVASVAPGRFGSKKLAANEILIESPHVSVEIYADGTTNLDKLEQYKRRDNGISKEDKAPPSRSGIEHIRLTGGTVSVNWEGRGSASVSDVEVSMRGADVHVVFGQSDVYASHKGWEMHAEFPRAAFDFQRGTGLQRLLADGGKMELTGASGKAKTADMVLSRNSHASGSSALWQLSARTGIDQTTGLLRVEASPTLTGFDLAVHSTSAPLNLIGPWLPKQFVNTSTLVSGELSLQAALDMHAVLDLQFEDLVVSHPVLAQTPLELDIAVRSDISLRSHGTRHFVEVDVEELRSADLSFSGQAYSQWVDNLGPELVKLRIALAKVSCDAALSSLPAALRPVLAGLELRGTMASELDLMLSRDELDDTKLDVVAGIGQCKVAADPPAANVNSLASPGYVHLGRDGESYPLDAGSPSFTALRELPEYVAGSFVAAEDARFFQHNGFDPQQIQRSIAIDMQQGRLARGGSTITQQLVKNLFLHRRKSLARKLQETVLAWRLESVLSKERILEIYLNIIEFGDSDTYGITAAAQRWFEIPAEELSILQTAFLAAIVPEPVSMSIRIRNTGKLDDVSAERVAVILRAMKRGKVISKSEFRKAKAQTLRFAPSAVAPAAVARASQ